MPAGPRSPWLLLAAGILWAIGQERRTRRDISRQKASASRKRNSRFAEAAAAARAKREDDDRIRAPYLRMRELRDRARQVDDLFKRRPDLGQAWDERLIDKFEADGGGGPFELATGKVRGMRGPRSDTITDLSTGYQLAIVDGDVADNEYSGQIWGKTFHFSTEKDRIWLWDQLDDKRMRALARLFNADVGPWQFSWMDKPVTIIRRKPEYQGEENEEKLLRAKIAFGESYRA